MPNHHPAHQQVITSPHINDLISISKKCRRHVVDMLSRTNSLHIGCTLSIIDILVVLYHHVIDTEKIKTLHPTRDIVVLSKGHAVSGLYAVLASVGIMDEALLEHYHSNFLTGTPTLNTENGIEVSAGSPGHGLSIAVGLAIAAKHDNRSSQIYVVVGDGECQTGAVWEAIMMAVRLKLNNLTIIVDYNTLQATCRTDEVMAGTLSEKFQAFGCNVLHADGHNYFNLINVFNGRHATSKPDVILARTVKGKGVSFIENKLESHHKSLKGDQVILAHQELSEHESNVL
jgi:transketolase